MAEKLTIKFSATGDKALIASINALNAANVRLIQGEAAHTALQNKLQKELKQTGKDTDKVNKSWVKYHRNVGKAGGITTAFGKTMSSVRSKLLIYAFAAGLVTAGMKKLFDAFIEQEKAEKKLETALGKTSSALLNQASALQQITTFGDEAIIGAQSLIAAFTDDEEQIKLATKATLDLAAAKGMDLKSAADLVSKTIGSSTNSLSRYGIEVEGAVGSTERLESLTTNIAQLYGGQAAAAADTFGGRLEQLSNIAGDVNEQIGEFLSPAVEVLADHLRTAALNTLEFFTELNEFPSETIVRKFEQLGIANENLVTLKIISLQERLNLNLTEQDEKITNLITGNEDLQKTLKGITETGVAGAYVAQYQTMTLATDKHGEALEILKTKRDTLGKTLRTHKDLTDESVKSEVDQFVVISQLIALLENYAKTIDNVSSKIGQLTEETEVVASKTFLQWLEENQLLVETMMESGRQIAELFSDIASMATESANKRIKEIDRVMKHELDTLKNSRKFQKLSAFQQAKEEEKIRAKAEKQKEAERKKANKLRVAAFRVEQALNIAGVIQDTAAAIMKAQAQAGIFGVGWIPFFKALGAAQIGIIAAQKPPKMAQGGLIGGRRHAQGGTMIEAEAGEFVMSRQGVESVGIETLNRINEGGGSSNINIVFEGNVLSEDFIVDEAIPKIKEALRRGEDIGIS